MDFRLTALKLNPDYNYYYTFISKELYFNCTKAFLSVRLRAGGYIKFVTQFILTGIIPFVYLTVLNVIICFRCHK